MTYPTENNENHGRRLNAGWAVWEGGRDLIQGAWPGTYIGRDEHCHAHKGGPFFNHGHRDGQTPHDHAPGDRRLPKWAREAPAS